MHVSIFVSYVFFSVTAINHHSSVLSTGICLLKCNKSLRLLKPCCFDSEYRDMAQIKVYQKHLILFRVIISITHEFTKCLRHVWLSLLHVYSKTVQILNNHKNKIKMKRGKCVLQQEKYFFKKQSSSRTQHHLYHNQNHFPDNT